MGTQNKVIGFIGDHKKGVIIAVVAVIVMVVTFGFSSKFILDSREGITSMFEMSMSGPDEEQVDGGAFTRDDGMLSMSFTGNVKLFEGVKGSLQGTMEDEYSGNDVSVVRLNDPHYARTIYLRAAHYTTYVLRPLKGGMYGIWGLRVVDDNGEEPDVCYWMNLKEDNTVTLGTEMSGDDWPSIISSIESSEAPVLTWEINDEGACQFTDTWGQTFTVNIDNSVF